MKRILKMCGALLSGQGISLLTQLLLPPLFLRSYGIARYGEWLTLSAAVTYLGTLNFGLQTFANNRVGISYNRGELEEVRTLQSTAFALLLGIVATAAFLSLAVFFLPVTSWLKLDLTSRASSVIIYLLGLQVLSKMIFGFLSGSFLALGIAYRGTNWNNAQTLASLLGTALLAFAHVNFASIAAVQFALMLLFAVLVAFDLRIRGAILFPRIAHFRRSRVREILKPSGYFAMLYSSNFLVYQLPVVLMQRLLGPQTVVVFSLTRTIYSMSRQVLNSMSFAIGPEIVELYGQRNWLRLLRLYELSERAIFALVPAVSVGTFMATPILIAVWLHKPQLYDPGVCILMALISAVMGTKEHKYQFQTSSNEHTEMARFWLLSYVALVVLSLPAIRLYGVYGFLALWLATEIIQVAFVLRLNRRFFERVVRLDFSPVYRLAALMTVAMAVCSWFALSHETASLLEVGWGTIIVTAILTTISFPLFKVNELSGDIVSRLLRRA